MQSTSPNLKATQERAKKDLIVYSMQ
uniref:Uncharacterized protein n=1 Tax=Rhizophora mucronata TaxID=61149 RepID=A0A2P2QEB4_RHIMU